MSTTVLPTKIPKTASEAVKVAEEVANIALKKATLLANKLKIENKLEEEESTKGLYGTIEKGMVIFSDSMNFCSLLLTIIVIYYFYKGYASQGSQYGGGYIEVDQLSDYTYD